MTRRAGIVFAATLFGSPILLFGQNQSPDQQQEKNNKSDKSSSPHGNDGSPHTGQSPDIQQEKNGGNQSVKKSQTHGRQAHGTPKPKKDTASDTSTSH